MSLRTPRPLPVIARRTRTMLQVRGARASQIADRIGMSYIDMQALIDGRFNPDQVSVYRLSAAFNVKAQWLVGGCA